MLKGVPGTWSFSNFKETKTLYSMIKDLVLKNRSFRRFYENETIPESVLLDKIRMIRLCSSGRNAQPLRYLISNKPEQNEAIFPYLRWAGYLKDWDGPKPGERPSAYVVVCAERTIQGTIECDAGIAIQSLLFGLVEEGFGGCIIGSIDKAGLREKLNLGDHLDILYVVAMGKPKEIIVLEEVGKDGDIKYWRDEEGVHHVPKRRLEEVLLDWKIEDE